MKQALTASDGTPAPHASRKPDQWVVRFSGLVRPAGTILDLACGSGRHGRLFLGRGHPVVLADRDISGLQDLTGAAGAEIVRADLEDGAPWPLGVGRFAGIVVFNYLHRPLVPAILDALEPEGVLIWQTFAVGNERFGRPRNPDFLLAPGELLAMVHGRLRVVAYEHGAVADPHPASIQRICAVRDAADAPPRPLPPAAA